MSAQTKRFSVALLFVGALVVLIASSGNVFKRSTEQESPAQKQISPAAIAAPSEDVSYDIFRAAGGATLGSEGIATTDAAALFDPGILDPTQVISRDGVIGIISPLHSSDVMARVRAALLGNGWCQAQVAHDTPSDNVFAAGFVKQEGPLRWVYVICQPVVDATSVVMYTEGSVGETDPGKTGASEAGSG